MTLWVTYVGHCLKNGFSLLGKYSQPFETWVQSLGGEDPLEEEMATHSIIFAQRIPVRREPGGLQSVGSQSPMRLAYTWTCYQLYQASIQVSDTGIPLN